MKRNRTATEDLGAAVVLQPEGNRVPATSSVLPQSVVATSAWRGASGTAYPHSVTSLLACPPIAPATYLLARRDNDGNLRVLSVGSLESAVASLNLARIRQKGAALGANEVHYHTAATSRAARARVAADIEEALVRPDGRARRKSRRLDLCA